MSKLPVDNLDFFEMKSAFLQFLKTQDRFKDYNFEGSNMNVLLDVLSYNTYYNQFYNNMTLSEMFLDSSQLRNSAISHAKALNYVPSSKRSSTAKLNLTITSDQLSNYFSIPKFTRFNAKCGDRNFTFVTNESITANRSQGTTFIADDVVVYEGRVVEEVTTINELTLKSNSVDTTSIEVFVNKEQFVYTKDIFGVAAQDKVFYVQAEPDGYYSIYFGENSIGYQPDINDEIRIRYRITHGVEANGINSIVIANRYLNGAASIVTQIQETSLGGRDHESLQSIKKFAPRAFQIQERAVTRQDYAILLQQRFPRIQAISVFGGDEVFPPQYGSVIISVDVSGGQGASDSEIAAFEEYLIDKTPLTISPVFVQPKFVFVQLDVKVTYDRKQTRLNATELTTLITRNIAAFAENNINGFNSTYSQSKVVKLVDNLDEGIQSVDITAVPYIEYNPILDVVDSPTFDFGNKLEKNYPLNETQGFGDYEATITSTTFVIDNVDVMLQDDGRGNLLATTVNVPQKAILKRNIGTVDYETGVVRLSNFSTSSYEGSAIKIFANTESKNIYSQQDRIIEILQSDITLDVSPITTVQSSGYATIGTQTTGTIPVYIPGSGSSSGGGVIGGNDGE